jgi:branched-chain amino acid transport system ATP-binding protein
MSATDRLLRVDGISKHFGAVVAVDNVSFELEEGVCQSLIGPNGAGKTTMFNCISGIDDLTSGSIEFNGEDVTDASADKMARAGLARSFQIDNLFDGFTAFENVRLGAQILLESNTNMWSHYQSFEDPKAVAEGVLDRIGLSDAADMEVSALSHGQKRQLEVGMTLASDPDLILLDEPTSGLATENVSRVLSLIEDITGEYTTILVEHNVDVVMQVSDRIMVLDRGELIADAPPEEIRNDERVQEAYLGADAAFLEGSGA